MTEQFFPSLLDRLRGDSSTEFSQGISLETYRALVIRDVKKLLNHSPFFRTEEDSRRQGPDGIERKIHRYPNVATSVLNYGLEIPSGSNFTSELNERLALNLQTALENFEPRLVGVQVGVGNAQTDDRSQDQQRLRFRQSMAIKADLLCDPYPIHLTFRTEVDVIGGHCDVLGNGTEKPPAEV